MQRLLALLGLHPDGETLARLAPFLRGISMGALVGAAIAGSTIWRRGRARRDGPEER